MVRPLRSEPMVTRGHAASRPRWHDALIVVALVGVLAVGVWALWWADVRAALGWDEGAGSDVVEPAPVNSGQT